jgi:hypothetical protein
LARKNRDRKNIKFPRPAPTSAKISIVDIQMDTALEIVRVVLALGIVLSNVAVWRGVYLENDKFPKETRDAGWRLLVKGLAAESALAFFTGR